MENSYREKEIDLIDLFFEIFYKWRIIIICMVLGVVAGAAYKYDLNVKYNASVDARIEERARESEEEDSVEAKAEKDNLTTREYENVVQAVETTDYLSELIEYQKNSILLNLKPSDAHSYVINYSIQASDENGLATGYVDSIETAYVSFINDGGYLTDKDAYLSEDIKDVYIAELVKVADPIAETSVKNNDSNAGVVTFSVEILGASDEQVKEIAELVKASVSAYSNTVLSKAGAHTLSLVSEFSGAGNYSDLISLKQTVQSNINNVRSQLATLTSAFTDGQTSLYNSFTNDNNALQKSTEEEETDGTYESENLQKVSLTSGLKKYVLLGLLAGLLIPAFVIAVVYVLNASVKTSGEMRDIFNLFLLGDFSSYKERNGFGAGVDRFIDKLKYKNVPDFEEERKIAITNIKLCCNKNNINKVLLASSTSFDESSKTVVDDMTEVLKGFGINSYFVDNAVANAGAFEDLSDIGYVVMCEKMGKSSCEEIARLKEMCGKHNAEVFGAIAF